MASGAALTIGEVINLLKDEFPDVTVSKVRFLESQGLIDPARSTSGYRQFHSSEVKRLRFILQQQRDHFLPLKVIRSQLTLWERGEEPPTWSNGKRATTDLLASDADLVDAPEIMRQAELSRAQLKELLENDLIAAVDDRGAQAFSENDVAVAKQCAVLMEQGFEARHLRSVRHSAERHGDLLDQLTAGIRRNRSPDARRQAAETLAESAEALGKLSALILAGEIRSFLQKD